MNQNSSLSTVRRAGKVVLPVAILGLLVAAAIGLAIRSPRPVLLRWTEGEEKCTNLDFTVFNPRRDRSPEVAADRFFDLLHSGKCDQAMSELADPDERRRQICPLERDHKLRSWDLRNRTDRPNEVELYYWIWHDGFKDHQMAWVIVRKVVGQRFQVTDYWCIC